MTIPAPQFPPASQPKPAGRLDAQRLVFWAALATAAVAGGVALTAGESVGRLGGILIIGLAALGAAFVLWMGRGRGRDVGLFPERGAAEHASLSAVRAEFSVLDAIGEPAMVSDRHGAVLAANAAYLDLAKSCEALIDGDRAPMVDHLFGADPALSAPMYRLARAAGAGERRAEHLPPANLKPGQPASRFEASVGPMPAGRVLWRLRPLQVDAGDGNAALADQLIEEAPAGFMAVRADGAIVFMNAPLRVAIGLDDVAGLKLRDLIAEDPQRLLRRDRRANSSARTAIMLRTVDGRSLPAQALSAWPGGDGDGACRIVVLLDAADAAGAAAAPSAGRDAEPIEAFFRHAPYGAALLDGGDPSAAAILDANPALMELAQGAALPGASFADLFEASEGPDALSTRLRKISHGQAVDLTLAADPPVAVHVHIVRMGDGRALAYMINVAEQRELEQRLAQSEKMREIGLLAGGVAHDFNNLLTVMMQTTDYLLLRHPYGDPDYAELNQINIHALRAKELSEMLRAYARQQTFRVETFEVAGFVQQMHELARRLAGDAVRVEVQHGQNLPYLRADKAQLERVLVNLVSNARDAMTGKEGLNGVGVMTLRTSAIMAGDIRQWAGAVPVEDGDYVQIEVADSGCGISAEDQHKIFHPFHSTKDPGKGTGLGLATSYGIIKQSGGYIFFDSKLGKGTTFRVFLPAYRPNTDELAEMAQRERARLERKPVDVSGRGRILFVEDDEDVRSSTVRNLAAFGFEITCAEDGEAALEILRADKKGFNLIISDISMPIMTGPEMVKAAGVELLGGAKVLFLTGYAPESVAKMIADLPMAAVMSKPVGASALAQKMKQMMAA
ncbi:MAG: ATP-binding protein [Caulobacterales bacterium]|jgi:two-component system cell cycle sensor histidine kinase/response regulator CckA